MTKSTRTITTFGLAIAAGCITTEARQDIDSAAPVTVIGALFLESHGQTDLKDISSLTPYIAPQVVDPNNNRGPDYLRGFERTGPAPEGGIIIAEIATGHTANATFEPVNKHDSAFASVGLSYLTSMDLASGRLSLAIGADYVRYDKAFDHRNGDDQWLHDFYATANYSTELSGTSQLDVNVDLNYNENGSIPLGHTWIGALHSPVVSYKVESTVSWRTDGLDLQAPGWMFRSGVTLGGFNESGGSFADSSRLTVTQEAIRAVNEDQGFYFRTQAGVREFKEMTDYDSAHINVVGGIFGKAPCGAMYQVGAGVELREYDQSDYDERTVPILEARLFGDLGTGTFSIGGKYGIIGDRFANWAGGNSVDMEGLEAHFRFRQPLSDKVTLGVSLESSNLKANSSQFADGHINIQQASLNLNYQYNENTSMGIDASLNRVSVNSGGPSANDTFGGVRFVYKMQF